MITRQIEPTIRRFASEYPVVTVMGPRQAGKSTLVRTLFPDYAYANLEDGETRELARHDAKAFFSLYPAPLVIDEVQLVPELLSQVQLHVDRDRSRNGQFILTGSHQSALASAISQSLAGRTAIADMMPLAVAELPAADRALGTDEILLRGFMPELIATGKNPVDFYRFYYRTYVERDVNAQINLRHRSLFDKFMRLMAGRVGQLLNLSSLSGEVGVSSTTLEAWLSVLEASFVVFRLQPHFANVSKRLVKTPKVYFHETGLLCHLLGIESAQQLSRDPLRGNVFENMVVAEQFKRQANAGREPALNFLRTSSGFEIDLLVKEAGVLTPVEIKSAMTFSPTLVRGLAAYRRDWNAAAQPELIYDGRTLTTGTGIRCLNFRESD